MMKPKKEQKIKPNASIALQLNAYWSWRLLLIFIKINLLFIVLGVFTLIHIGERETNAIYQHYKENPTAAITNINGDNLTGFKLPRFINFLYGQNSSAEERRIIFKHTVNGSERENRPPFIYYSRTFNEETPYDFTVSCSLDDSLYVLIVFSIVLFIFELLLMITNTLAGINTARKKLQPISQLARQTNVLQKDRQHFADLGSLQDLTGTINNIDTDKLNIRIDIKEAQEELKELAVAINTMLDRIAESTRSQTQFITDASHELKTPIAVIQGYADLLDRWGKEDADTLQESIEAIKEETQRMKNLTNDLLFLARSNSLKLEQALLNANDLLSNVYRESIMIDSKHHWELRIIPEKILIRGDYDLLKQVLRIIVDNAIKYTPSGESIILKLASQPKYAAFIVQDNGAGIAEEDLPKIFRRFFRSDPSRTRNTGGAGLGLAIAQQIIEQHGGYFEILSRLEIGTRMTILIPKITDTPP
ncbi:MAG: HAMP domain-containing histidine kinase [Syntrophomonadaceae bacterium]|jgi:signal transduction histidine kinase|nr:HAMP domain-containing histidine kinase [Syntrophomonadaceae bacterium]